MAESMAGRILIVEDDFTLRRTLRTTLDTLGFETDDTAFAMANRPWNLFA